jgi:hypothetical protein
MDLAEGAFVWLAPSAHMLPHVRVQPDSWSTMAHPYDVPIKGGRSVSTVAFSPFVDTIDPDERARIRSGLTRAMASPRIDVLVKFQNTMRFLDHADEVDLGKITKK